MGIVGKRIVITGGAGFIGSTLAGHLASANQIVLFDNLTRNTIQHTGLQDNPNISLVQGDILDPVAVAKAVEGADVVVHAAAIAGIDTVIKAPVRTMEVNMIGTANVLRAAQLAGVRDRVIEFSTSEVFGSMAYRVSEESFAVAGSAGEARWVYAVSKLAGEHLAHAYFREHNLPTVTLRWLLLATDFFTVWDTMVRHSGLLNNRWTCARCWWVSRLIPWIPRRCVRYKSTKVMLSDEDNPCTTPNNNAAIVPALPLPSEQCK